MTSNALKSVSNSSSWSFAALYKCVVYLSQPWDLEVLRYIEDCLEEEEDNCSDVSDRYQSSDDSKSWRSLDINLDYMAYVKRAESITSPAANSKITNNEHDAQVITPYILLYWLS